MHESTVKRQAYLIIRDACDESMLACSHRSTFGCVHRAQAPSNQIRLPRGSATLQADGQTGRSGAIAGLRFDRDWSPQRCSCCSWLDSPKS